jgi:hypothetical protein
MEEAYTCYYYAIRTALTALQGLITVIARTKYLEPERRETAIKAEGEIAHETAWRAHLARLDLIHARQESGWPAVVPESLHDRWLADAVHLLDQADQIKGAVKPAPASPQPPVEDTWPAAAEDPWMNLPKRVVDRYLRLDVEAARTPPPVAVETAEPVQTPEPDPPPAPTPLPVVRPQLDSKFEAARREYRQKLFEQLGIDPEAGDILHINALPNGQREVRFGQSGSRLSVLRYTRGGRLAHRSEISRPGGLPPFGRDAKLFPDWAEIDELIAAFSEQEIDRKLETG